MTPAGPPGQDGEQMLSAIEFRPLTMPDINDFLTVQETATALHLHAETVRDFLRTKTLTGRKIGTTWIISKASIEAYKRTTSGMNKHDPRRGSKVPA